MNKLVSLFLLILIAGFFVGCGQIQSQSQEELNKQNESNVGEVPNSTVPHGYADFTKSEAFKGGNVAADYALVGVRRLPHPEFTRLSFDFAIGKGGESPATLPPEYEISYDEKKKSLSAFFKGVNWNLIDNQTEEILKMAPVIKNVTFEQQGENMLMSLDFEASISYQVFDLANPARIAIVIAP